MDADKKKTEPPNPPENARFLEKIGEFSDMDLKPELLEGIFSYGFKKPSEIQQRGIMPLIYRKDVIAQAQSGTGKTATFVIGTLQNILIPIPIPNIPIPIPVAGVQVLVVAPTRELAYQIQMVYQTLGKFSKIKTQEGVGGTSLQKQLQSYFQRPLPPHVMIGTPGRLFDLLSLEKTVSSNLQYLIIDEADEMFSRGFKVQIYRIFKFLPRNCKIALFSATLPKEILQVIELFMSNPVRILVKKEELTLEGIRQFYLPVEKEEWKIDALADLVESLPGYGQIIIYVNLRKKVEWLANALKVKEHSVSFIHGEMGQFERTATLEKFRMHDFRLLITTDLLSRGIDIKDIHFVINYDLPLFKENYIHRIGRSGRFGKKGVAINFLTRLDIGALVEIEGYYETTIELLPEEVKTFFKV